MFVLKLENMENFQILLNSNYFNNLYKDFHADSVMSPKIEKYKKFYFYLILKILITFKLIFLPIYLLLIHIRHPFYKIIGEILKREN